ncbi:SDR family oxidoreductase [Natronosporangium hydrolyticum]|uniref:SDR family oxidoreductase n=1 Tax=Natronosporangium hydrolyticum TaxID=2811111 RepID=A0A895YNN1_9ACTN|nr:SDR family oxidoreductase [Natronosporangium hydrolyticum]QSB17089.1 SDR family oxidoreductase [Natronosporangium hydrolyticum]
MTLTGSVAVVTGGGSGIGAALARRFAAAGAATVVVADRDPAAAATVAAELPGAGAPLALDVADEAAVAAAVDQLESEVGPIDLWCSNAGVAGSEGLGDDADWQRCWSLHVHAHVLAARHVLPRMLARDRGHLLVTASAAGLLTEPDSAPYAVTKHASVALAEWLAIQHGGAGVSFSCLCPQAVRTPMVAGLPDTSGTLAAGEIISPEQVADSVMAALAEQRFLILPHPEVAAYEQRRAAQRERWLAGMRKVRARLRRPPEQPAPPRR